MDNMDNTYDEELMEKLFDSISENIDEILKDKKIADMLDPQTNSTTRKYITNKKSAFNLKEAYIKSLTTTFYLGLII